MASNSMHNDLHEDTEAGARERRRQQRLAVQLATAWSDGRRARQGEVLDTSSEGLFLRPAWAPSEPFTRGDDIELRCRYRGRDYDLRGEICWVGRSQDHDSDGFGLRIVNTDALARLIEELRDA